MRLGWRKWAALALGLLLVLLGADTLYAESRTCTLPVLMYHHFAQEGNGGTIVSEARFREQMEALKGDGFTAVTLGEVLDYVDNGAPLPEKPVLITMDDGYTSNLEIAAPILEELGFRATVFVIGVNEGRTAYLHDGKELKPPRFSYEEASEWVNKGVLDLQSHTWDMHQLAGYGFSGRDGVRALPGEKKEDWKQAVAEDLETFREARKGRVATELVALAYPFGYWDETVDRWLEDAGIALTFTTEEHANRLRVGDRDSLRCLGRYNVTECYTGQALVALLGGD